MRKRLYLPSLSAAFVVLMSFNSWGANSEADIAAEKNQKETEDSYQTPKEKAEDVVARAQAAAAAAQEQANADYEVSIGKKEIPEESVIKIEPHYIEIAPDGESLILTIEDRRGGDPDEENMLENVARSYGVPMKPEPFVEAGEVSIEQLEEDKIFQVTEIPPSFPGGEAALMDWLKANINYPANAQQNGISGRVTVGFVVEKDGSITNIQTTKSVDPDLDAEAMRVIEGMPNWIPGTMNGKVVRTFFRIPVNFSLE